VTTASEHDSTSGRWPLSKAILLATLSAGALDLGYALVVSGFRGTMPDRICQGIASGLLGRSAFDGGMATAALGLFLHFFIMTVIVLTFVAISRVFPRVLRQPLLWGPLYGAGVFAVMNDAVLPLSAIGHVISRPWPLFLGELGSHLFFVGMTIAWFIAQARISPRATGQHAAGAA